MRKSALIAATALIVLAGCGSSDQVDPDQAAAELALNRGPQDYAGPAIDAANAARRLADRDVRQAGGTWTIAVPDCKRSGPVMGCDIVVTGRVKAGGSQVKCSASAAVRLRAERGTAHRTPYACAGGT